MSLLRRLLGLCVHRWDEPFSAVQLTKEGSTIIPTKIIVVGKRFYVRCSKCGAITTFET